MNYENELDDLIMTLVKEAGSDIHFTVGTFPTVRVNRELIPLTRKKELSAEDTLGFLRIMVGEKALTDFVVNQELDFSYEHKKEYRLRGNASFQRGFISVALRLIPKVKTIAELNLPEQLIQIARERQGFFLVVGPVGQGKSTTIASMVDLINSEAKRHIITIEDPIEFRFDPNKALIEQREVGVDTKDFHTALGHVFRQDADVIMIGEMRDLETISAAVTAAETGHLVLSTLHTNSAAQTIDRIIDIFPAEQQSQIRLQLASSLIGVLSQRLIPRISGGLIPVFELLLNTSAVSNLIREKRTHEIDVLIETGSKDGMIDLDRNLAELIRKGEVNKDDVQGHIRRPSLFDRLL
ncbi:MAG: twitching motility protein twitching motility protein PilT [Candidatus Nomurabacteria bacterium]|nr:twitching motility protein twitching motility protein PilT [Candidatus Nomurabacteria bacterium]